MSGVHHNIYTADPNSAQDRENWARIEQAKVLSNQALQADAAGNVAQSIQLHNQAAALKVQVCGEESVQAAVSFNGIGECYLKAGDLQRAEEHLLKALTVRDDRRSGGLEEGPRCGLQLRTHKAAHCLLSSQPTLETSAL